MYLFADVKRSQRLHVSALVDAKLKGADRSHIRANIKDLNALLEAYTDEALEEQAIDFLENSLLKTNSGEVRFQFELGSKGRGVVVAATMEGGFPLSYYTPREFLTMVARSEITLSGDYKTGEIG